MSSSYSTIYCEACTDIFTSRSPSVPQKSQWEYTDYYVHHSSGGLGLRRSARRGCPLCNMIWTQLTDEERRAVCDEAPDNTVAASTTPQRNGTLSTWYVFVERPQCKGFDMSVRLQVRRAVWPHLGNVEAIKLLGDCLTRSITVVPERMLDVASGPIRLPPSRTWNPDICRLARRWIHDCRFKHTEPHLHHRFDWHPTRLIWVGTLESPSIRISLGSDVSQGDPYVTLSHCWGKTPIFTLLMSNYQQCRRNIQKDLLSCTFQEAIAITRDMGIRYIWIDSLCIIQDSREDWLAESLTMADVYSHSFCNIAATASTNGSGGCVRARFDDVMPTNSFSHQQKRRLGNFWGILGRGGDLWIHHATPTVGNWVFLDSTPWNAVTNGPLCSRAWVFQEQALAPRTLYFCAQQLFFGCPHMAACEEYPNGFPDVSWGFQQPPILAINRDWSLMNKVVPSDSDTDSELSETRLSAGEDIEVYIQRWCLVVSEYSKRALTKEGDRLVAAAGLAKRIGSVNTFFEYYAGIWFNELEQWIAIQQLLWSRPITLAKIEPPATYIAPTWSWAFVNGQIEMDYKLFLSSPKEDVAFKLTAKVVGLSAETTNNVRFAAVTSASLRLKGYLFQGTWRFLERERAFEIKREPASWFTRWVGCITFLPDTKLFARSKDVFYMPLLYGKAFQLEGIVLAPVSTPDGRSREFNRIGKFYIDKNRVGDPKGEGMFPYNLQQELEGMHQEVITIV